ncbi:MAG: polyprenyl synthetase family protein [Deltaproteobacteria bacterium]|nr:polyprenyl synthetase family protein [Deltaproteobacteria bacterium]
MTSIAALIDEKKIPDLDKETKEAYAIAKPWLDLVEKRIAQSVKCEAEKLTAISDYLFHLGGKRVRPVLGILVAKLFGVTEPTEDLINAGAGVELIHMATLLHDDIIDKSLKRRHQQSPFSKYGLSSTLLAGDFLLVRAFGLCAQLDKTVINKTEKACVYLTEGEELEGIIADGRHVTMRQYENVIAKKTASLFELCCGVGAYLANADAQAVRHMEQFGRYLGLAFQVIDDILDITADESVLGKPAGTDLKQKTPSIINILWLESGAHVAKEFFAQAEPSASSVTFAIQSIKQAGIIEQAREIAMHYSEKTQTSLNECAPYIVDKDIARQLSAVVAFTLTRCL